MSNISTTAPFKIATLPAGMAIPRLGAYWEGQGGYNAGPTRGENGQPDYYTIAIPPAIVEKIGRVEFGNYGGRVEGADHQRDGLANTLALIASGKKHPAAEACRDIEHDGHRDFYLASQAEGSQVYFNTHDGVLTGTRWLSTQPEGTRYHAVVQYVDRNGHQLWNNKYNEFLVCPVRRLIIQ